MLVGWAEAEALWKVTAGKVVARFGCCAGVHSAANMSAHGPSQQQPQDLAWQKRKTIIRGRIANHCRAVRCHNAILFAVFFPLRRARATKNDVAKAKWLWLQQMKYK